MLDGLGRWRDRMGRTKTILGEKVREALASVLPITAIVLALSLTVIPVPIGTLLLFLAGAVLLILGMGLFSLGAEMAMMPMGEALGARLTRTRRIGLVVVVFFAMGVIVTIAEPDLAVLARQVPAIPDSVLIFTVAAGVGFFLVLAMLRTLFKVKLGHLLIFFYALVFGVALFAPKSFLAVAFDSGGVTTGPITVPFIMALGIGMASTRGDSTSQEDSFGMVALSSVGPILMVLILGICYNPSSAEYVAVTAPEVHTSVELGRSFAQGAPHHAKEVLSAIFPMGVVLALLQLCTRAFGKRQLIKVLVGLGYTLLGLIMFLTGVNIGFMPAGHFLGSALALSPAPWSLILLGMVIGWYIVAAEPAVHVLNRQVEEITSGAVSQQAMQRSLSLGVAVSIGLSMARILWGIPLFWFILPGYALALGLSAVVPPIFTGIAFDSGGVASGPMTATFMLPLAMGACTAVGGNVVADAFGIVALVALAPLIAIQCMGVVSARKARVVKQPIQAIEDLIVDLE